MKKALLLLLLATLLPACFVQGTDEPATARITVALGGVAKGGPVDPESLVDLDQRPCYLGAAVTAEDLAAPLTTAWACDPGESTPGTVDLDLEVPAGGERELRVVAFLMEADGLVTLTAFVRDDWPSGVVDLDVPLTESPRGRVDGSITGSDQDVVSVRLVDVETGVRLPAVPATASGGAFHFTADRVPQGRFFTLSVELADTTEKEVRDCTIWATEGTVRVVNVSLSSESC